VKNILNSIDNYLKELEESILKLVEDQKIPLKRKNMLMRPIVDQKKVLLKTKKELLAIRETEYKEGCGMSNLREDSSE
jgi:hypothetical protein